MANRYPINEGNAPIEDFGIDVRLRARIAASKQHISGLIEEFLAAARQPDISDAKEILLKIAGSEILTPRHLYLLVDMTRDLVDEGIPPSDTVRLLAGIKASMERIYGPQS